MCSVRPMVLKPRAMARRMMASRVSAAWPGQNSPEWECIVKAILGVLLGVGLIDGDESERVRKWTRVGFGVEGILGSLQWRRVDDCGVSVSIPSATFEAMRSHWPFAMMFQSWWIFFYL